MTPTDEKDPTFLLKARLDQFFPPEHPDTPWLVRLAILRDDAAYEAEQLGLQPDASDDDVWRCAYTLRRLTITIGEAKHILTHDARASIKRRAGSLPAGFVEAFDKMICAVEDAERVVSPLRDGLGAHVRPENATSDPRFDPTPDAIRAHGNSEFSVRLDMHNGRTTSLRAMTQAAFVFAWPDVEDMEDLRRKHAELADAVLSALPNVFQTIDTLLCLHWQRLKIPMIRG